MEFITSIVQLIATLLVIFVIFFGVALLFLVLRVNSIKSRIDQETAELVKKIGDNKLIPLNVEQLGDLYLCYNATSNEFVCQGTSMTEIAEHFLSRFPNKGMGFAGGDETALLALEEQLKDFRDTRV